MNERIRQAVCLLLAVLCALTALAGAENSGREGKTWLRAGDSLAWNDQYVFLFWCSSEEEMYMITWGRPHNRLIRFDRETGESETLIEDYPYEAPILTATDDALYIFRQFDISNRGVREYWEKQGRPEESLPVIAEDEDEGTFTIVKLDFAGNILEEKRFEAGEHIVDQLMYGQEWLVATESRVLCLDPEAGTLAGLYEARDGIDNSQYGQKMVVDNGWLYLSDGERLMAVDVESGEARFVCPVPGPSLHRWELWLDRPTYLVLDGVLYFWDEEAMETAALHLNSGARESLSPEMFFFEQVSADGVAVLRLSKAAIQTAYELDRKISAGERGLSKWDLWDQFDFRFYEFADPERPAFSPGGQSWPMPEDDLGIAGAIPLRRGCKHPLRAVPGDGSCV